MSPKRWKGDETNLLPAQQVEPYRLWFEFLKLAHKDPSLKINTKYYRQWGNVENEKFHEWWSQHWRSLFAVEIGVVELNPIESRPTSSKAAIDLRIPLYQSVKRSLSQIAILLEQHGASDRLRDMTEGAFRFQVGTKGGKSVHPSTKFLRNLDKVRLFQHIYRFWLLHPDKPERRRLEEAAISYFEWANAWNTKIRQKKWNRPRIEIPPAIAEYVQYLKERGSQKQIRLHHSKVGDVSDSRRQIARYIRKSRKIATNVASGRFPGQYE